MNVGHEVELSLKEGSNKFHHALSYMPDTGDRARMMVYLSIDTLYTLRITHYSLLNTSFAGSTWIISQAPMLGQDTRVKF